MMLRHVLLPVPYKVFLAYGGTLPPHRGGHTVEAPANGIEKSGFSCSVRAENTNNSRSEHYGLLGVLLEIKEQYPIYYHRPHRPSIIPVPRWNVRSEYCPVILRYRSSSETGENTDSPCAKCAVERTVRSMMLK